MCALELKVLALKKISSGVPKEQHYTSTGGFKNCCRSVAGVLQVTDTQKFLTSVPSPPFPLN